MNYAPAEAAKNLKNAAVSKRYFVFIKGLAALYPPSFSFFLDAKSKKTEAKERKTLTPRGQHSQRGTPL